LVEWLLNNGSDLLANYEANLNCFLKLISKCKTQQTMEYDTLVISGASSSGIVLLGKLLKLELNGSLDISRIKTFAGTSIGAVISLLLIIGYSPSEIVYSLRESKIWGKLASINIQNIIQLKGIFSLQILEDELETMILKKCDHIPTIGELNKNFLCASFNLSSNKLVYFNTIDTPNMDAKKAVILSCAIPFLFEPCIFNNEKYIDGGILDNFPLRKTIELFDCNSLVGVLCSKKYPKEICETWQFSDFNAILFACSSFYTEEQIREVTEKIHVKIIRVASSVPFYDLNLSGEKIDLMFQLGFSDLSN
jgi:predicted acylesterase/phospholipase RssA